MAWVHVSNLLIRDSYLLIEYEISLVSVSKMFVKQTQFAGQSPQQPVNIAVLSRQLYLPVRIRRFAGGQDLISYAKNKDTWGYK